MEEIEINKVKNLYIQIIRFLDEEKDMQRRYKRKFSTDITEDFYCIAKYIIQLEGQNRWLDTMIIRLQEKLNKKN